MFWVLKSGSRSLCLRMYSLGRRQSSINEFVVVYNVTLPSNASIVLDSTKTKLACDSTNANVLLLDSSNKVTSVANTRKALHVFATDGAYIQTLPIQYRDTEPMSLAAFSKDPMLTLYTALGNTVRSYVLLCKS